MVTLKRRGLDLRGSTGRVEGSRGKLECLGGCGACRCSGWSTGGGADRAGGQKSRRLIRDILNLYLRDTQEAIHSRSEAGGRCVCGEVCVRRGVCGGRCVCVCRERRVCVEGRRVCGGEVYENPQYYFFHHYSKVTNKETRNLIEYKEQDF